MDSMYNREFTVLHINAFQYYKGWLYICKLGILSDIDLTILVKAVHIFMEF